MELNAEEVREAERATQSAERAYLSKNKEYKYRHSTLIEMLDISEEEQLKMETIISTKIKYRKNNEKRRAKRRLRKG